MPYATTFVALALAALLAAKVIRSRVVAQPDEWLLCIRNGRLVKAGIGISLWRLPWEVVARFTSTLQRVSFEAEALSRERLRVVVEGFILWSVSPGGDAPFRAFRKFGLANLDAPPRDLKSPRHLLSTPQHHAFQKLLGAAVQRLSASRTADDLLLRQDELVTGLRRELATLEEEMGIRIDRIEIIHARPADEELLRKMSAGVEERVREEAAKVQLEARERERLRAIDSEARVAEQQAEAARQESSREQQLRLERIEREREARAREQEIAREQALFAEATTTEVARAALGREALQLTASLDRTRREAEAKRDAIAAVTAAEEQKSQPVRDHELSTLVTEKVGDALKALPLHDARWVTVGADSPASALAGVFSAVRELAAGAPKAAG